MRLEAGTKRELVAAYMPVLLVASCDLDLPLDPEDYVAESALWDGRHPRLDDPSSWGRGIDPQERGPLVARGTLTVDFLPDAQIQALRRPGEFWLDRSGWLHSPAVTASSDNRQANLASFLQCSEALPSPPTLRAEVCDGASWQAVGATTASREVLGMDEKELAGLLAGTVIINYILLFPGHRGHTSDVFMDGTEYGADDHEADWACFSVVLSADAAGGERLEPRYAAFSRRRRSQSRDGGHDGTILRFQTIPWMSVPKAGGHACVVAAAGTHSLHPMDVATGNNSLALQGRSLADNIIDDFEAWVRGMVESNSQIPAAAAGLTIAKMAAGYAVAGPVGALGGLIAGVAEAGNVAEKLGRDPGPPEIDPSTTNPPDGELDDGSDEFDVSEAQFSGCTIISRSAEEGIEAEVLGHLTSPASIDRHLQWTSRSFDPIDRERERFWPVRDGKDSTGFVGRWGVRCSSDPFDRRAGDILPDFRMEVVRHLLARL